MLWLSPYYVSNPSGLIAVMALAIVTILQRLACGWQEGEGYDVRMKDAQQ